ncbi:hypothetical protein SteCoe_22393 [Stentor coeruleus]|uniref:Uncharacterized protein n=1 Tax=Stentor coeruleus TaxID=5963 RepID=A0A1R2BMG4_9CILI|nr:hypothetical protein SteCoe_22393 [Stentor coeruleus]
MILTKLTMYFLALVLGNQMKIQTYETCDVSICESEKVEMDSDGTFWPKYCYQCPNGEEEVIFLREYTPNGWHYTTTKDSLYQGRLILNILPCDNEEVDSMGNRWETWCFDTGDFVSFEKLGEKNWVYKQDYAGGYGRLQFRRILDDSLLKIYKKPLENNEDVQDSKEKIKEKNGDKRIVNNFNSTEVNEEIKNTPAQEPNDEIEGFIRDKVEKLNENTIKNKDYKLKKPENQEELSLEDEFSVEVVKSFTDNFDLDIKHKDLSVQTSKDCCENENPKKDMNLSQKLLSPSEPTNQNIPKPLQKSHTTETKTESKESDIPNDSQQSTIINNLSPTKSQPKNNQNFPETFLVSDSSTLINTLENSKTKSQSIHKGEISENNNQETNKKSEIPEDDSKNLDKNIKENSQSVIKEEIILPNIEKMPFTNSVYEDSFDKNILDDKIIDKKNEAQKISENLLVNEEKNYNQIENNDAVVEDDQRCIDSFEGNESDTDTILIPCSEVEGDKSGRYFYVDYDDKMNKIDYIKDDNGNFVFDTETKQRVSGGFLSPKPIVKEKNTPCTVYDIKGKIIELEADMYIKDLFWQVVYENGIRVKFMRSTLLSEKINGSYLIDPNTGYRYRSFI